MWQTRIRSKKPKCIFLVVKLIDFDQGSMPPLNISAVPWRLYSLKKNEKCINFDRLHVNPHKIITSITILHYDKYIILNYCRMLKKNIHAKLFCVTTKKKMLVIVQNKKKHLKLDWTNVLVLRIDFFFTK